MDICREWGCVNYFAPENAFVFMGTVFLFKYFNNCILIFQVLEFLEAFFLV